MYLYLVRFLCNIFRIFDSSDGKQIHTGAKEERSSNDLNVLKHVHNGTSVPLPSLDGPTSDSRSG